MISLNPVNMTFHSQTTYSVDQNAFDTFDVIIGIEYITRGGGLSLAFVRWLMFAS